MTMRRFLIAAAATSALVAALAPTAQAQGSGPVQGGSEQTQPPGGVLGHQMGAVEGVLKGGFGVMRSGSDPTG